MRASSGEGPRQTQEAVVLDIKRLPVAAAMPRMLMELQRRPELGFRRAEMRFSFPPEVHCGNEKRARAPLYNIDG
jgi:hypothetical protein